jgi:hypothetical protein
MKSVLDGVLKTTEYKIKLAIKSIAGGIPKGTELLEAHLRRKGLDEDKAMKVIEEHVANGKEEEGIEKAAETASTTFLKDDKGFYIVPSNIKALCKEAAVALGTNTLKENRGIKHQTQVALWISEEKIYFMKDGKHVAEPSYQYEKAIHVMSAQGPRDTLIRTDVLTDVTVEFTLCVVDAPSIKISENIIKQWFKLAENGVKLGAHRPLDFGNFVVVGFDKS